MQMLLNSAKEHKGKILILLSLTSFLLYFNTLFNEYALDDEAVILKNRYTQQGIKGIPTLATHHLFYGIMEPDSKVGLYRPLPLVTFALEYEFFGQSPFISHLINVLLYTLITYLLFQWLSNYIFKDQILLCSLITFLFLIHPIHTEAVANIKSRDELLSMTFILASQILLGRFLFERKNRMIIASTLLFGLALFSKESAITFIPVIALLLYFFFDKKWKETGLLISPFLLIGLLYIIVKLALTGFTSNDNLFILNTPYLYANPQEEFATKIFILVKYISLLFFPHPLSYDYCFNQIPYLKLSDPKFLFSLLLLIGLVSFSLRKFRSKNIYSFCILFFFITISIVSNFAIQIGAPMGERFLFLPSVGFAIGLGFLLHKLFFSQPSRLRYGLLLLLPLTLLASYKTVSRNFDWKNNTTLFLKDYESAPNSIRVLTNSATFSYYYEIPKLKDSLKIQKLKEEAIKRLEKAKRIDPKFPEPYVHLTYMYLNNKQPKLAAQTVEEAIQNNTNTQRLEQYYKDISNYYLQKGHEWFQKRETKKAFSYFQKSANMNPENADAYWNMGGICLEKGEIKKTIEYWEKTLQLKPDHPKAKILLERVKNNFKGKY